MVRSIKFMCACVLLLGLAVQVRAEEVATGKIKITDLTRNELVIKGIVKDTVYEMNKDAQIWLDGARSKLADLKEDDRVAVFYDKKGEHLMARSVRALRNAKETTGKVEATLPDKQEVTIKGLVKNTTYELDKGGTVWVDGKLGSLKDVRAGDEVLITYVQRGEHLMASDVAILKRK